jgi:hypothetical protein
VLRQILLRSPNISKCQPIREIRTVSSTTVFSLWDGSGVETDLVEAAKYFKMSANQGNSYGRHHYGFALRNGEGVEKDLVETEKYVKLSAD